MRVDSYDSIMMDKVKPTEALWEPLSRRAFVMPGKRGDYVPRSPKKPCAYPGCPRLTDRRFCPEHEKLDRDRYNKNERSPDVNRKYGRAWKRIRDRYVAAHPLCEQCLKEGRLSDLPDRERKLCRGVRRQKSTRRFDGAAAHRSERKLICLRK